jgi:hypothetical protein
MGKIEELAVNDRKIPLSLEVGFWNLIIAFLTIFRDIRTFSQTTPAAMPTLRKKNTTQFTSNPDRLMNSKIKIKRNDLFKIFIRISLLAMLGFVLGVLSGLLIGI